MSTSPPSEPTPQPQPQPQPEPQPVVNPRFVAPAPPPPRRGGCGSMLVVLLLLGLAGSLFLNFALGVGQLGGVLDSTTRVQEKFVSHNKTAEDKVVILPVEGLILENEDGFVKRAIDTAMKDNHIKALVLRVDSPGGTVSGSDYILHHLRKLAKKQKIPIVVSMGSIAASGGYYVSMAVGHQPDAIFAEPTGFTGSIGVIIPHYNISGLMKKYDVSEDSIASHPLKKMGSITQPMSKEERAIFDALVQESFAHFKDIVCSGRGKFAKDREALDKLATGQIFTAEQAAKNGLVDKLGFVEDAVDRAIELAGLDADNVKVVRYKPEVSLTSALMGGESQSAAAAAEWKTLLEMTTPKAYYLASWLPGVSSAKGN